MKDIFDSYFEVFFKGLNDLSPKGFEKASKFYNAFYKDFMPENKNAEILDVACGPGHFLYFLNKIGYKNFHGIDISGQQIKFCQEKITTKVEKADAFEYLKGKESCFDLIISNDFLEHIQKPKLFEYLELVNKALKKGGRFFAKVPNMSNPFSLMDRYSDLTHEIGFTEFSLREALLLSDFNIIKIKGSAYPLISLKNLLAKIIEQPFYGFLKFMFRIQGHTAPKILDKELVSIVEKK